MEWAAASPPLSKPSPLSRIFASTTWASACVTTFFWQAIRAATPYARLSDEQLEQLKTAAEVQQALQDAATHMVEQSEAQLKDARSSLAKTTILAPMSGRVTRLAVEQGLNSQEAF